MATWQEKVHPELAKRVERLLRMLNHKDIRVVQSLRTFAEQDALYAQGRTKPGKRVTNAKGGFSNHNYGLAVDLCPFTNGKPDWNDIPTFKEIGKEAKIQGLEWGGDWTKIRDMPHVQLKGMSIKDCRYQYSLGGLERVWSRMNNILGGSNSMVFEPNEDDLIEVGDIGAEVEKVQTALVGFGLMKPHEVDGDFGKITKAAVVAFQRIYDLTADGIVGENTKRLLFKDAIDSETASKVVFSETDSLARPKQENAPKQPENAKESDINIDSMRIPTQDSVLESNSDEVNQTDNSNIPTESASESASNQPDSGNKDTVYIQKPKSETWFERMWAKITGGTSGNVTLQAATDKLQQVGGLGLSAKFWTLAGIVVAIATIAWLIYEWHKKRKDDDKQLSLTELLVKENSTPNNRIEFVEFDQADWFEKQGLKVIKR